MTDPQTIRGMAEDGHGEALLPNDDDRLVSAANPAKVAELRELVDKLYLAAGGAIDPKTARLAANELAKLADALEAGGGLGNGYAAVPLIDQPVTGAPFPPPKIEAPYGTRANGSPRSIEECD